MLERLAALAGLEPDELLMQVAQAGGDSEYTEAERADLARRAAAGRPASPIVPPRDQASPIAERRKTQLPSLRRSARPASHRMRM